jgi:predicted acetyltransferase
MPPEIRAFDGDVHAYMQAVTLPFGWSSREEDTAIFAPLVELDRALAAYETGRVVGTAAAFSMQLTIPGGELPMAGVTMVGVHPTHRRRGLLRQLMRRQLDDIHEQGEAIAGLWASEAVIYQRFGYGLASLAASFEIDRGRTAFRRPHQMSGTLRLVSGEEAAKQFSTVFEQVRPGRPGIFARSPEWWASEFVYDPEHSRRGGSAASFVLHETDGAPTGYARYRLYPEWDERGPKSSLEVSEAIGVSPAATLDVWRYLFDVDLVASIRSRNLPVDHPLLLTLAEPRRLGWSLSDGLWLRLVDVVRALEARSWAQDGELVLELSDDFCPWNAGRLQLSVSDGRASVSPTQGQPDLELDAGDLAATYLGGVGMNDLVRAGRVVEHRAGSATTADSMLWVPAAPWCPQVF